MKTHERKWLGAWGGSLLIHAGVVGVAALAGLLVSPTGGGGGLLTVELGGPGGMAGGLGDKQHEGQKGDGGANASRRRQRARRVGRNPAADGRAQD